MQDINTYLDRDIAPESYQNFKRFLPRWVAMIIFGILTFLLVSNTFAHYADLLFHYTTAYKIKQMFFNPEVFLFTEILTLLCILALVFNMIMSYRKIMGTVFFILGLVAIGANLFYEISYFIFVFTSNHSLYTVYIILWILYYVGLIAIGLLLLIRTKYTISKTLGIVLMSAGVILIMLQIFATQIINLIEPIGYTLLFRTIVITLFLAMALFSTPRKLR